MNPENKKTFQVALYTSAWIEMEKERVGEMKNMSHSIRVRGLKYPATLTILQSLHVALYTSAWIEIHVVTDHFLQQLVALYTSAWIEIQYVLGKLVVVLVALYTSAWIEISSPFLGLKPTKCRTLYECVD